MKIRQKEADKLMMEFDEALSEYNAEKMLNAWDHLMQIMKREKIKTDQLGHEDLDWQIANWAQDTVEVVHNARMYDEEIRVNEQILKIHWTDFEDLVHENAKRDIADAYAYKGDVSRCFELYEEYLKADPLWGWAWIGYFRMLKDHDPDRFVPVLDELYAKVKAGTAFRDKKDLYSELSDEYSALEDTEKADFFKSLFEKE